MGYKITMSEIGPISLNETDPVKSILQNVSIILRTIKGSCPMYRGFGIDATLIDRPIPAAKVLLFSQIREAIENMSRASVSRASILIRRKKCRAF